GFDSSGGSHHRRSFRAGNHGVVLLGKLSIKGGRCVTAASFMQYSPAIQKYSPSLPSGSAARQGSARWCWMCCAKGRWLPDGFGLAVCRRLPVWKADPLHTSPHKQDSRKKSGIPVPEPFSDCFGCIFPGAAGKIL